MPAWFAFHSYPSIAISDATKRASKWRNSIYENSMKTIIALLLLLVIGSTIADAATITWTNTAGGNWSGTNNWSPNQVPGSSDDAVITASGTYTVNFDASATIAGMALGGSSGTQTFSLGGNTLTLNGLATINSNGLFNLSGGNLAGTNGVIAGLLTWTSGGIASGSTLTVGTNGLLVLAGNSAGDYDIYGTLTNAGTVRLVSGNLQLYCNPGQLINLPGALVDITTNNSIDHGCGGELLLNYGTVRKSGGTGASTINCVLNNFGLIDVQTGTVNINGGDTANSVGVFQTEAGAALDFVNNFTANSGVQFTGAGTNLLTGGTFTLNGLVTFSNLTLAGASLAGTNGVIAGLLTWTSGGIASGSTLTVGTNGLLVLAGNSAGDYDIYGTLTNAGTVRLVSGNLQLWCNPGQLINLPGALVDITTNNTIDHGCGGELLVNYGTVRKSGGTGASTINCVLNNFGLIDVQTGTVNINGGDTANSVGVFQTEAGAALDFVNNFTANSGVQFTGAGTNLLTGGTFTLNGLVTFSNLTLAGASLAGTNGVIAGLLTWTSGGIASGSTLTVGTNGLLVLAGNSAGDYTLYGILTNAGTVRLVSGNLQLWCNPGQLINLPGALVDITTNNSIDHGCGGELLVNYGTVRKSGGTGTSTINPVLNNFGLIDVQTGTVNIYGGDTANSVGVFQTEAGATLDFVNNFTANSGVQFTGVGTNIITAGTFTFNGLVTISNLTLAGASLAGTNGMIAGVLPWTSGSIVSGSTLTVATNGLLVLAGNSAGDYDIYGTLTNAGTVRLVSGNLQLWCNPGQLINLPGALVDITTNNTIDHGCGGELLVNYGTVRKSGGTGASTINCVLNNFGLIDVQTGTVNINGGDTANSVGVFQTEAGAALDFVNNFTANSGVQFTGAGTNLLTGGTFTLNGLVTFSNLTLAGASLAGTNGVIAGLLTWTSGGIASGSTLTVGTNGLLVLAGNSAGDYDIYGTLTNAGTVRLVSGNLQLWCNPGQLINLPGALVDITTNNSIDHGCGGELLVNYGTVRKSGGTGISTIYPILNNFGLLDAQTGTVSLNGSYTLTGGTLNVGISGPNNFGLINLVGAAALNGTLSANLNNGYMPGAGNSFAVITYGSRTGYFTDSVLPTLGTNEAWQVSYAASSASLDVVGLTNGSPQISGAVTDSTGHPIPNVTVFAYAVSSPSTSVADSTSASGNYLLVVTNGTWSVGVAGLSSLGYVAVGNQIVVVSNTNKVVNFVVECINLQSPSNIVVSSCAPIQVFYTPTFTDPCCNNVNVACNPASGSFFSPGTVTTVQCVATDSCGNTNSSSFTVTVTPQQPLLLFNTGVDDNGSPLAAGSVDPHYSIVVNPNDASPSAFVPWSIPGSYTPNSAVSQWISPTTNGTDSVPGPAVYHYQTTFSMPYGNTVMITGRWGADNYGAIYIDSSSNNPISTIPSSDGSAYSGWQPFTFNGYLAEGMHTLTCVVTNPDAPDATALRVELSGFTGCSPIGIAVGSTVMQAGTTSSVPVNLLTSVALTNLSFTLVYPPDRFTNWFVAISNSAIGAAAVQDLNPTQTLFNFGSPLGQAIQGPTLIGSIYFSALPGQSAFLPLEVTGIIGSNLDGSADGDTFGQGGRVVVIGPEPLLAVPFGSNSTSLLILYGNPGTNYQVLFSTNLLSTNWQVQWSVTMTNLIQYLPVNQTVPQIFYRAVQQP